MVSTQFSQNRCLHGSTTTLEFLLLQRRQISGEFWSFVDDTPKLSFIGLFLFLLELYQCMPASAATAPTPKAIPLQTANILFH